MNGLRILGMTFFSLLVIAGLMTANGVTGNIIASSTGAKLQLPAALGYGISIIGVAGFFVLMALNKKEEDYY